MFGLKSVGIASDIVALGNTAVVEEHTDRLVLRSPTEPDFWDGNKVIFRDGEVKPSAQIARFQSDFPAAAHVSLAWDAPGLPGSSGHRELEAIGFSIERSDVLVTDAMPRDAVPPAGIELRRIESLRDWAGVEALQYETGVEEGHDPNLHRRFIADRMAMRRRQSDIGSGAWFGAFEGDRLVGDLGLMRGAGIARYQSVETRATHRGRGICPALLRYAADWAVATGSQQRFVIIADAGGMPARLYQRQGFEFFETILGALRPPSGARGAVTGSSSRAVE